MGQISFLDKDGTFTLKNPERYSYLYFPIAGEAGLKSAITPRLSGDAKHDKNTFLLEPVSAENLHNNRSSRNFWCNVEGKGCWSATGVSAAVWPELKTFHQTFIFEAFDEYWKSEDDGVERHWGLHGEDRLPKWEIGQDKN